MFIFKKGVIRLIVNERQTNLHCYEEATMRFFVMRVSNDTPGRASTAYASCWINDPSRDIAFDKAKRLIRDQGWSVEETIEDYPICREDYADKAEGLDYYEQALVDTKVIVFLQRMNLKRNRLSEYKLHKM